MSGEASRIPAGYTSARIVDTKLNTIKGPVGIGQLV